MARCSRRFTLSRHRAYCYVLPHHLSSVGDVRVRGTPWSTDAVRAVPLRNSVPAGISGGVLRPTGRSHSRFSPLAVFHPVFQELVCGWFPAGLSMKGIGSLDPRTGVVSLEGVARGPDELWSPPSRGNITATSNRGRRRQSASVLEAWVIVFINGNRPSSFCVPFENSSCRQARREWVSTNRVHNHWCR